MAKPSTKVPAGKLAKAKPEGLPASEEKFALFGNKPFMRFVKDFGASNEDLLEMVASIPDADLGGGVFKFRLARAGEGTSGGARTIVAMKAKTRAVMMFGFEKKDQANISAKELRAFKKLAKTYLERSAEEVEKLVKLGELITVLPKKNGKAT